MSTSIKGRVTCKICDKKALEGKDKIELSRSCMLCSNGIDNPTIATQHTKIHENSREHLASETASSISEETKEKAHQETSLCSSIVTQHHDEQNTGEIFEEKEEKVIEETVANISVTDKKVNANQTLQKKPENCKANDVTLEIRKDTFNHYNNNRNCSKQERQNLPKKKVSFSDTNIIFNNNTNSLKLSTTTNTTVSFRQNLTKRNAPAACKSGFCYDCFMNFYELFASRDGSYLKTCKSCCTDVADKTEPESADHASNNSFKKNNNLRKVYCASCNIYHDNVATHELSEEHVACYKKMDKFDNSDNSAANDDKNICNRHVDDFAELSLNHGSHLISKSEVFTTEETSLLESHVIESDRRFCNKCHSALEKDGEGSNAALHSIQDKINEKTLKHITVDKKQPKITNKTNNEEKHQKRENKIRNEASNFKNIKWHQTPKKFDDEKTKCHDSKVPAKDYDDEIKMVGWMSNFNTNTEVVKENKCNETTTNKLLKTEIKEGIDRSVCSNTYNNNAPIRNQVGITTNTPVPYFVVMNYNSTVFCTICATNVVLVNQRSAFDHLHSFEHINNYCAFVTSNKFIEIPLGFYCELCTVYLEPQFAIAHSTLNSHQFLRRNHYANTNMFLKNNRLGMTQSGYFCDVCKLYVCNGQICHPPHWR